MPHRLGATAVFGALLLTACGSSDDPALDPSAAPSVPPPSNVPPASTASEQAACEPAGTSLSLKAKAIKWDTDCLAAPAGQAFTITIDNTDTVAHNVAILASHSATDALFRGDLVQGPKKVTYDVPALPPGTYVFHCEVHPTQMLGTFVVK